MWKPPCRERGRLERAPALILMRFVLYTERKVRQDEQIPAQRDSVGSGITRRTSAQPKRRSRTPPGTLLRQRSALSCRLGSTETLTNCQFPQFDARSIPAWRHQVIAIVINEGSGDHGGNKRNNCDHTRDPDEVTRILRPMHLTSLKCCFHTAPNSKYWVSWLDCTIRRSCGTSARQCYGPSLCGRRD